MNTTDFSEVKSFALDTDYQIPNKAIDFFNQDGVICLRNAFNPSWLQIIESGIKQALNGSSTNIDIIQRKQDTGTFSVSSGAWMNVGPFRQFIFDSHIADIAQALLQSQQLVLFYDFLLIKQAFSNSASTPWHQDHSYYPLDGKMAINCWVALDDIPIESALRFMQSSHQSGMLYRAIDFDSPDNDYQHARKELPLPPNSNDTDFPTNILCTAVKAGDMLAWTSYTLHSAPGNQLDHRRAAFSVNWLGDDITYNGKPSLDTYRDPSQVTGQHIICDKFPLLRSK